MSLNNRAQVQSLTLPSPARRHADISNVASLDDVVKGLHLITMKFRQVKAYIYAALYRFFDRGIFVESMTC